MRCPQIDLVIDNAVTLHAPAGMDRADTRAVCGDANNGFGLLVNWNLLAKGEHTIRALADGEEFAEATFTVTTFGEEFLTGASGQFILSGFPQAGTEVTVRWQESLQNFAIVAITPIPEEVGSGPGFATPREIALEATGSLVVADRGLKAVLRVDLVSGNRSIVSNASTGTGPDLGDPLALAVEATGTLVVLDPGLEAVVRVDPISGNRTIVSKSK